MKQDKEGHSILKKSVNTPKGKTIINLYAPNVSAPNFSKEEIQMAKKRMKKCSPSLAIKEMQIKTTLRFHLNLVRISIIKNTTTGVGEDVGKKEPLYTAGGNAS
jgi:hypothetical protein